MFFKPPEVKAISKYADFGSHLGAGSFGIMLLAALLLHAGIIGMYAMMPHNKIIKIPVRVLNINLGSNISDVVPASEQPLQGLESDITLPPPPPPPPKVTTEEPVTPKKAPQLELDKELSATSSKAPSHHPVIHVPTPPKPKEVVVKDSVKVKTIEQAPKHVNTKGMSPLDVLAADVPKKYVRSEPQADKASPKPSGDANQTSLRPEEIVQRYEQTIGLWIRQHKIYPEEAKRRHSEGDVTVRVRINRQGHILYSSIETPSGDVALDRAAMSMVRASDPAPPVPDNYPEGEEFEFLEVLTFTLKN